jgi:hypothetical protein
MIWTWPSSLTTSRAVLVALDLEARVDTLETAE